MSVVQEQPKAAKAVPDNTSRVLTNVVIGLLIGASIGPALFIGIKHVELKGDTLFAAAVGAFLTFATCFAIGSIAALLIVPRVFRNARGALVDVVGELTQASQAHADGDSRKAIEHVGRAANESAAWYSIGATRRFVTQAALGLLFSFGGVLGVVLLYSQNALLREQNGMIRSQNEKIDKQVRLLEAQNGKIDQQTMVADSQKRGAFATEMFAILQEVAKATNGDLPKELVTRISVLSSSAIPYQMVDFDSISGSSDDAVLRRTKRALGPWLPFQLWALNQVQADAGPSRMRRPLSPERGQLVAALARLKINLFALQDAGAQFESADLRNADLSSADLSNLRLDGSDFTGSLLSSASFQMASMTDVVMDGVVGEKANFKLAIFNRALMDNSSFALANFDGAMFSDTRFKNSVLERATFVGANLSPVSFEGVMVRSLPAGVEWPQSFRDNFPDLRRNKSGLTILDHYQNDR